LAGLYVNAPRVSSGSGGPQSVGKVLSGSEDRQVELGALRISYRTGSRFVRDSVFPGADVLALDSRPLQANAAACRVSV